MIRCGRAAIALCGKGRKLASTVGTLKGWEALRVLSADTCRPFSRTCSGLVLGEGAAILVLKPLDRAMARDARIYAELRGLRHVGRRRRHYRAQCRGRRSSNSRGIMADARIAEDSIDYINAHGTGTMLNDVTETKAIRAAFGVHADRLAISSSKAVLGHGLGAAGALEAAATALAIHRSVIPPTANFEEPDSACDLDVIPNVAREKHIRYAISNSFAFGGAERRARIGRP